MKRFFMESFVQRFNDSWYRSKSCVLLLWHEDRCWSRGGAKAWTTTQNKSKLIAALSICKKNMIKRETTVYLFNNIAFSIFILRFSSISYFNITLPFWCHFSLYSNTTWLRMKRIRARIPLHGIFHTLQCVVRALATTTTGNSLCYRFRHASSYPGCFFLCRSNIFGL